MTAGRNHFLRDNASNADSKAQIVAPTVSHDAGRIKFARKTAAEKAKAAVASFRIRFPPYKIRPVSFTGLIVFIGSDHLLAELDAAEQMEMQVHDSLATVLTAVVDDAVAVLQVFRAIVYQRQLD